ncbi:MAG: indole-3-glycerol phosphate synthase TrpC [Gammaproteobacteria bacterium]|nr:indole-3-glycerol phosphate synthase TrpC [Gammaproteobacteria bacterium]
MSGIEFLNKIIAKQTEALAHKKQQVPEDKLREQVANMQPTLGFAAALSSTPSIIAEMKKASPSTGLLRANYDAATLARSYAENGAACISVLTNEHFEGEDEHLLQVREAVTVPLLRKDFIIDEYQVYETRVLGADALLLIAACLDDDELIKLGGLGLQLGLDVLFEAHSMHEAQRLLAIANNISGNSSPFSAKVILGVNSRDLHSFKIDLTRATEILSYLSQEGDYMLVGESGIKSAADISRFIGAGAHAFLIGESFMRAEDPGTVLKSFLEECINGKPE